MGKPYEIVMAVFLWLKNLCNCCFYLQVTLLKMFFAYFIESYYFKYL